MFFSRNIWSSSKSTCWSGMSGSIILNEDKGTCFLIFLLFFLVLLWHYNEGSISKRFSRSLNISKCVLMLFHYYYFFLKKKTKLTCTPSNMKLLNISTLFKNILEVNKTSRITRYNITCIYIFVLTKQGKMIYSFS